MGANQALLLRFLKFGVVGCTGTAIDFGLTWLCKEVLHIKKFVANAIGFVVAATNNYILNRIWTWESSSTHIGTEYLMFFGVSVVGLGINTLILFLLHEKAKLNFYVAKVGATIVVMLWNFLANNFYTFANC